MGTAARSITLLLAVVIIGGCAWMVGRPSGSLPAAPAPMPTPAPITDPPVGGTAVTAALPPATPADAIPPATVDAAADIPVDTNPTATPIRPATTDPAAGRSTPAPPAAAPPKALGLGQSAQGGQLGGTYELVGLRSGEHDGFTRLVWELSARAKSAESGVPLWEALQQVNGREPKAASVLDGSCHIRLRLADTYAMNFTGAMSLDTPKGGPVNGVRLLPMEDDSSLTFAVDLAEPAPYTVTVLQAPLRIVIDVYRP